MGKVSRKGLPWGVNLSDSQARIYRELLRERESGIWPTSDKRIAAQLAIILEAGEKASQRQLRTAIMLRKTLAGSAPTTLKDFRKETRNVERVSARKSLERFFEAQGGMIAAPVNEQQWETLIDNEIARKSRIGFAVEEDDA